MGCSRGQLLAFILLLIGMVACSDPPSGNPSSGNSTSANPTVYNLQTSCSGGGGARTCVAQNASDNKLGPFDLEIEFLDERGVSIGRTVVGNDQGLEPRGEWRFNLTGPTRTRSLRFGRVIPR